MKEYIIFSSEQIEIKNNSKFIGKDIITYRDCKVLYIKQGDESKGIHILVLYTLDNIQKDVIIFTAYCKEDHSLPCLRSVLSFEDYLINEGVFQINYYDNSKVDTGAMIFDPDDFNTERMEKWSIRKGLFEKIVE